MHYAVVSNTTANQVRHLNTHDSQILTTLCNLRDFLHLRYHMKIDLNKIPLKLTLRVYMYRHELLSI